MLISRNLPSYTKIFVDGSAFELTLNVLILTFSLISRERPTEIGFHNWK